MIATLTIIRYRRHRALAGLFSMALFRLPLWLNRRISFWKLLGSGKNGRFGAGPDWGQYGIFTVVAGDGGISGGEPAGGTIRGGHRDGATEWAARGNQPLLKTLYGPLIAGWVRYFGASSRTWVLEPLEGHGTWDGEAIFGDWKALGGQKRATGGDETAIDSGVAAGETSGAAGELSGAAADDPRIAVLTRATVRWSRLRAFRSHIAGVEAFLGQAPGLLEALSIGESPLGRQATFSVWDSKEAMIAFAYGLREHQEVIRKTRAEQWYSEELFARFRILHEG